MNSDPELTHSIASLLFFEIHCFDGVRSNVRTQMGLTVWSAKVVAIPWSQRGVLVLQRDISRPGKHRVLGTIFPVV